MLTELPFGYSGRIFRSPMPFSPYDPMQELWTAYQAASINVVVLLTEPQEYLVSSRRDLISFYKKAGLEVISFPIPDFQVPANMAGFEMAIQSVVEHAEAGRNIVVHCMAGIGRTGVFLACLAHRRFGFSATQAVKWVREYIPNALENQRQVQFVRDFQTT